ncbi:uncharacterized protein [Mytilus edulis]|uniref:uncharacterized protein n=1 Tax=Mytilus edulis TaxID=6550 RepID=UPI0039EEAF71
MASAFWKIQFLFVLLSVWFYSCVDGKSERILTSSTDVNGERLHQMDLTIQNMKSQISGYDSMIQQIQTLLSQKDTEIKNLTAEISSLKRKVAFMAELTGTYLHPTSGRHIVYDNLYLNDGNGYHSSHGTFIAPYRGLYHFSYGCTAHLGA